MQGAIWRGARFALERQAAAPSAGRRPLACEPGKHWANTTAHLRYAWRHSTG